jgi:hypothetical protein
LNTPILLSRRKSSTVKPVTRSTSAESSDSMTCLSASSLHHAVRREAGERGGVGAAAGGDEREHGGRVQREQDGGDDQEGLDQGGERSRGPPAGSGIRKRISVSLVATGRRIR